MSAETRTRLIGLVVFALPLVVVKGAAWLRVGAAPQSAVAATAGPTIDLGGDGTSSLTETQRRAAAYLAELPAQPFGRPPLDYKVSDQVVVVPDHGDPNDTPPVLMPQAKLQVIFESSRGDDVALIDGRRYREGDTLSGWPWIVREIDGENRCVILKLVDGQETVRLSIDPVPEGTGRGPRR